MKPSKPQIIVAQLGARMHYAVPVLLQRAGMLAHFYTDAYLGTGSSWAPLSSMAHLIPTAWQPPALKRLLSRRVDGLPPEKVTAFNLFGLSYALAQRWATPGEPQERVYLRYGQRFAEMVLQHPAFKGQGLYSFPATAGPLLPRSTQLGMKVILEQFIAPRKILGHILSEEYERWPGWEFPSPWASPSHSSLEVEEQEFGLADAIICPSDFVAKSLMSLGTALEKLHLVPYGVDYLNFSCDRQPWNGKRRLHLLFMGGVDLRKGIPYLYQALEHLNTSQIEVRLVGSVSIREPYRSLLGKRLKLVGQVPRSEVRQHYAWADVFVFPSLCEGSATVTYEALAAGLPVITTPNAGSFVQDGVDGFIVPIRDAEALAAKIELFAGDSALLAQMAAKARDRAREFCWEKYGERLIGTLQQIV